MSTATAPERPHAAYAEPDEYIDYQLRKTQTGIKRTDMLTAGVVAITVLMGYVLLFVLSDHWLFDGGVGGTARVLMFLPVIGFVGWLIGAKVIWPALKNVSGLYAAKTLETSSAEFRSSLLNLVDLKQAGREVSPVIMATIEKRAAVTLTKLNIEDAIDKQPLLRTLYVLFGIVVAFCLYSVLSPKKLGPSVLRAIVPFTNVTPATQTEILEVKPGDTKLRAGGILPVSVQLRGEIPADVTLLFTTADGRFVDEPVQLGATTDPNSFEGTLGNDEHGLLQSFTYHIVAGDARSPEYRVEIIAPPSATVTEVRFNYPEYMELDPRTQLGGAIDVWERTAVTITAMTNVPVKRGDFELADTEDFSAAYPGSTVKITDGKTLSIAWRADPRQADGKFPKFYRVKVWDAEGNPDPKPAVYPINVRLDQPPQVALIDPTTNLELPANGTVPLVVAARDQDFKLRTVSLKIARDENDVTDETLFDGSQQEVALKHDFPLEPLRLKEGNKIRIWVEAQDNRMPTHNLAKTPPIEITIKDKVTKEEAKKQLEEHKKEQQKRLDEAAKNNSEQGNDRTEPQSFDNGNSPDQPPRDPNRGDEPQQPKFDDPGENPPPKNDQPQPGDDKTKGQAGSSSKPQPGGQDNKAQPKNGGKPGDQQSGEKGNEQGQSSPGGKSGQQQLKNDGSQDQEALEKIVQRANEKGQLPKPNESSSSPSSSNDSQDGASGDSANKPNQAGTSKPDPNGKGMSDDKRPMNDAKDGSSGGNAPKTNDDKRNSSQNPQDGSPSNTGQKSTDGKNPNAKPGDEPKPGDGQKPKPGDSQNGNSPDSKNPMPSKSGDDSKSGQQPAGANDSKSPNNAAKKNGDNGEKPMPGQGSNDKKSTNSTEPNEKSSNGKSPSEDKSNDAPSQDKKSAGGEKSDANPSGSEKKSDGMKPGAGEKSSQPDSKNSSPDGASGEKSANDQSQSGNKSQPGGNKSSAGKKTESGQDGEGNSSEKSDATKKPRRGNRDSMKEPSDDQRGDDSQGQAKDGQAGSQKSNGQKPSQDGAPQAGKTSGLPGQGSSAGGEGQSSGRGESASEEANPEFTKEAANLVLKKIKDELDRGEVDQELLDELGWTPEQMKKFVERMQSQTEDKGDDNSPAAQARRRQFEETLKNLNLTSKTQRRDDTNKNKQTGDGIGPVRRPPPPEYREAWEAYTKSRSKQQATEKK